MKLPVGSNDAERANSKKAIESLIHSTVTVEMTTIPDIRDREACHGYCKRALDKWVTSDAWHGIEYDKWSRFFKVYQTVYERDDSFGFLNNNTHGTLMIVFADGATAHFDNGWFARTGALGETQLFGDSNIPRNYRRDDAQTSPPQ